MSLALRTVVVAAAAGAIAGADPAPRLSVDHLPARLDRSVAWRAGAEGIEFGELQLTGSGEAWRTRVIVARLDPRRVTLSLEAAFHQPRLDVSGTELVTVDDRLPFDPAVPAGTALRRLAARPSPLLFACPSAVLEDLATGARAGMTEPMQPRADAVAE